MIEINITQKCVCDYCGYVIEETLSISEREIYLKFGLPEGWSEIMALFKIKHCCNKHKIVIDDKTIHYGKDKDGNIKLG